MSAGLTGGPTIMFCHNFVKKTVQASRVINKNTRHEMLNITNHVKIKQHKTARNSDIMYAKIVYFSLKI